MVKVTIERDNGEPTRTMTGRWVSGFVVGDIDEEGKRNVYLFGSGELNINALMEGLTHLCIETVNQAAKVEGRDEVTQMDLFKKTLERVESRTKERGEE